MAKKQARKTGWGFSDPSYAVQQGLAVVERYLAQNQWSKALTKFEELEQRYPKHRDLLEMGMDLFSEIKDWKSYLKIAEKLVSTSPERSNALFLLAWAYLNNHFPFLALKTHQQFVEKFPNAPQTEESEKMIVELKKITDTLLTELKLGSQDIPVVELHEESQILTERGEYTAALEIIGQLLDIAPTFVPAFNNLSLIYQLQEKLEEAISTTQRVLEIQPDNFHALANSVHFALVSEKIEIAQTYAQQLRQLPNDLGEEIYLKKAEAFSYLRDDRAIISLGEEAEKNKSPYLNPLFWHWLAVAYANQGDSKKARQLWQKALQDLPTSSLIQENLDNLKLSIGERTSPWAFELDHWVSSSTIKDLARLADEVNQNSQKKQIQQFLQQKPELTSLVPILLDRGSLLAKKMVFSLVSLTQHPQMLEAIKEFTLSERGSDQERLEAGQIATQAGLIPSGHVRMFIKGEWQDLLMMGMEISDEPPRKHPKKVDQLLHQGILALKEEDGKKAENFLTQALSLEPDAPDLKFNLAGAYQLQQREEEALELVKQIHHEYPDYAFAPILLARQYIQSNNTEEAEQLLKPLLSRKHFHFQEFAQFCQAQIELAVATKKPDAARSWLGMWERVEPDAPSLSYWKQQLKGKKL